MEGFNSRERGLAVSPRPQPSSSARGRGRLGRGGREGGTTPGSFPPRAPPQPARVVPTVRRAGPAGCLLSLGAGAGRGRGGQRGRGGRGAEAGLAALSQTLPPGRIRRRRGDSAPARSAGLRPRAPVPAPPPCARACPPRSSLRPRPPRPAPRPAPPAHSRARPPPRRAQKGRAGLGRGGGRAGGADPAAMKGPPGARNPRAPGAGGARGPGQQPGGAGAGA